MTGVAEEELAGADELDAVVLPVLVDEMTIIGPLGLHM